MLIKDIGEKTFKYISWDVRSAPLKWDFPRFCKVHDLSRNYRIGSRFFFYHIIGRPEKGEFTQDLKNALCRFQTGLDELSYITVYYKIFLSSE